MCTCRTQTPRSPPGCARCPWTSPLGPTPTAPAVSARRRLEPERRPALAPASPGRSPGPPVASSLPRPAAARRPGAGPPARGASGGAARPPPHPPAPALCPSARRQAQAEVRRVHHGHRRQGQVLERERGAGPFQRAALPDRLRGERSPAHRARAMRAAACARAAPAVCTPSAPLPPFPNPLFFFAPSLSTDLRHPRRHALVPRLPCAMIQSLYYTENLLEFQSRPNLPRSPSLIDRP